MIEHETTRVLPIVAATVLPPDAGGVQEMLDAEWSGVAFGRDSGEALFHAGDVLGVPREFTQVLVGGAGSGSNAYLPPDARKLLRRLDAVVRAALFAGGAERKARAHMRALRARYEARATLAAAALDDEALLRRVRYEWAVELPESLLVVMGVSVAFQQAASFGCAALASDPAPAALLARLLDPQRISVSTQQVEDLVELARALRAWEGAAAFFDEVKPDHAARGSWRDRLPAPLFGLVEAWLERYGHRGQYESEVAQPRYADDLRLVATAVRPLVLAAHEPEPATARRARRRANAEAGWREVASVHGHLVRMRVRGPAQKLGRLMLVREELRSEMMRRHWLTRQGTVELGRRLVARGRLDGARTCSTSPRTSSNVPGASPGSTRAPPWRAIGPASPRGAASRCPPASRARRSPPSAAAGRPALARRRCSPAPP
jgi:hypothetical protein